MKFTRRPDLAPQIRIHIVMLAWLHRGVYGKMTAIAKSALITASATLDPFAPSTLHVAAD